MYEFSTGYPWFHPDDQPEPDEDVIPEAPKYPERICWGCEKLCPTNHLNCRETRVPHPKELYQIIEENK